MELPKRKPTRLPNYDYSQQNYYFITVCTADKKCIFGKPGKLNEAGNIAGEFLQKISSVYDGVYVDKYVVMPNHIHALIVVEKKTAYSLTHIIGQYKMSVTKAIHKKNKNITIWQRSFHDHVVRNEQDYQRIWTYILGNPQRWREDCFYMEEAEY